MVCILPCAEDPRDNYFLSCVPYAQRKIVTTSLVLGIISILATVGLVGLAFVPNGIPTMFKPIYQGLFYCSVFGSIIIVFPITYLIANSIHYATERLFERKKIIKMSDEKWQEFTSNRDEGEVLASKNVKKYYLTDYNFLHLAEAALQTALQYYGVDLRVQADCIRSADDVTQAILNAGLPQPKTLKDLSKLEQELHTHFNQENPIPVLMALDVRTRSKKKDFVHIFATYIVLGIKTTDDDISLFAFDPSTERKPNFVTLTFDRDWNPNQEAFNKLHNGQQDIFNFKSKPVYGSKSYSFIFPSRPVSV